MDIFLAIVAALLLLVGFAGCVLPVLPGLPVSYLGLLLLHFTDYARFSTTFLLVWLGVVVLVQVMDYFFPAWTSKKWGAGKAGVTGSTIGVLVGMFLGPWGIVLGPFVGAVIGEMLAGKEALAAIKAGMGSFVGFLLGTMLKLIIAAFFIYYYITALI